MTNDELQEAMQSFASSVAALLMQHLNLDFDDAQELMRAEGRFYDEELDTDGECLLD